MSLLVRDKKGSLEMGHDYARNVHHGALESWVGGVGDRYVAYRSDE